MIETELKPGMLVVHPTKSDWGPGKIVKLDSEHAYVFWRDAEDNMVKKMARAHVTLTPAPRQTDPILDNLPPLVRADGTYRQLVDRYTVQQAIAKFKARFSGGFYDPAYIGTEKRGERHYKWNAHLACVERLGGGRFRKLLRSDPTVLVAEVQGIYRSLNLLSVFEKAALTDALQDNDASTRLLRALADVLDDPTVSEETFEPYLRAVRDLPAERGRVATWPVATLIPFLMHPDRHLFLKPDVTKKAAAAMGVTLNYRSEPNWLTYRCLLELSKHYMAQLSILKPRDMIDIQSFFWVVCGGDE